MSKQIKRGMYVGSFDPMTNGHVDLINRSLNLVDELVILVSNNINKKYLFSLEERINMINLFIAKKYKNFKIIIDSYDGLTVDYAEKQNINFIIRGIRNNLDLNYEFNMDIHNKKLNKNIDTIFLLADLNNSYISSSSVKEIAYFGGDISHMIPNEIKENILNKINNIK